MYSQQAHEYMLNITGHFVCSVTQLYPTPWDHMDCSPPGSSVYGILQARFSRPEWVAVPFARGSSQPRNKTWVSWIVGMFFTSWAISEAQEVSLVICFTVCNRLILIKGLVRIRHGLRVARVCILSGEETKDGQNMFREKDRKENEIPGPTENVLLSLSNELFLKYL